MNRSHRFAALALVPAIALALSAQADTPPAKTSAPAAATTASATAKTTVSAAAATTISPAAVTATTAAPATVKSAAVATTPAATTKPATATVAAATAAPVTTMKPATTAAASTSAASAPAATPTPKVTATAATTTVTAKATATAVTTATVTSTAPAASAKPAAPPTPAASTKPAAAATPTASPASVVAASPVATSATSSSDTAALDAAIAGSWRKPANVARDKYRHPKETLQFFGVKPDQTLLEITPGGGWYTEILAPLLRDHGHLAVIVPDPAYDTNAGDKDIDTRQIANLNGLHDAHPDVYAKVEMRRFSSRTNPAIGEPGSADVVVTFRNVHNWVMAGNQAAMFKAFFDVLKPGGVLGVTDHRANPGKATDGKMGYLTEQQVIDYATAAGFVLDGKSEINANPKDTKDYPHGVWTLPPTLSQGNHGIGTYTRIGESDRMTLRFHKPGK